MRNVHTTPIDALAAAIEERNRKRAAAARQLSRYFDSDAFVERYLADNAGDAERQLEAHFAELELATYFAEASFGHAANLATS